MRVTPLLRLTLTLLPVMLALSACNSAGRLEMARANTDAIPPGRSVALWVKPTLGDHASKGAQEDASETSNWLRAELFNRLVSEGIFNYVFQPGEPADYHMDVSVTEAKEVSQNARFWLGPFAGRNDLAADVALYDEATGDLLTRFRVTGESASMPTSSRTDIEDAVHEAVDKIISALKSEA